MSRLSDVAEYLGRDAANVTTLMSRLSDRVEQEDLDHELARLAKIVQIQKA